MIILTLFAVIVNKYRDKEKELLSIKQLPLSSA